MNQIKLAASNNNDPIERVVKTNVKQIRCNNITITRGRDGSFHANSKSSITPALISEKVLILWCRMSLVITSLLLNSLDQTVTNLIGNIELLKLIF